MLAREIDERLNDIESWRHASSQEKEHFIRQRGRIDNGYDPLRLAWHWFNLGWWAAINLAAKPYKGRKSDV